MRKLHSNPKKLAPLIVCSLLVSALGNAACASNITDGNGQAFTKDPYSGHFELRPDALKGDVGFKKFQDLQLSKGDILDFIFQAYNLEGNIDHSDSYIDNIKTFVNLVQNQIDIQGIVNTIDSASGAFTPGNLVFVSPRGMVVGASGVLNVGSLSVYTPTTTQFDALYNKLPVADRIPFPGGDWSNGSAAVEPTDQTWNPASMSGGTAPITIDGMVVARSNVTLDGSNVDIGTQPEAGGYGGLIIAGSSGNAEVLQGQTAADTLFNNLVSAGNTNSANQFSSSGGKIVITSSQGTNIAEGAKVRNYSGASGETTITNNGTGGVTIDGEVSNVSGTLTVKNNAGALDVGGSGLVRNNGTMNLTNQSSGTGISIAGTVENDGTLNITNDSGNNGISISGSVTNDTGVATITNQLGGLDVAGGTVTSNGTSLVMDNYGDEGIDISGTVNNNSGTGTITNYDGVTGGIDISGKVFNNGTSIQIDNTGEGGINISGHVDNDAGSAKINNYEGGLTVEKDGGKVTNDGSSLYMNNQGADGFLIAGLVDNNKGTADLNNSGGSLDIVTGGEVENDGESIRVVNSGSGFNISGLVDNNKGDATLTNMSGTLDIQTNGQVINDGDSLLIDNYGLGGISISGLVDNNENTAEILNTEGALTVQNGGRVENAGTKITMTNQGDGGFTIAGTVHNTNGQAEMTNEAGELLVASTGEVIGDGTSQKITMKNTTGSGFRIVKDGSVTNTGSLEMANEDGNNGFTIDGTVINEGDADISNAAGLLNISGSVTNTGDLDIYNHDTGTGFDISGAVSNAVGIANLTNDNGDFNILANGVVSSTGRELNITNNGKNSLYVHNNGKVINDGDELAMTNSGAGGFIVEGLVDNNSGDATLSNNSAGNFDINEGGIVDNGTNAGTLTMTNSGTGALHVHTGGTVLNDGDELAMTNNGSEGFIIDGLVDNNSGDATLSNNSAGNFDINEDGIVDNGQNAGTLTMNNSGTGALDVKTGGTVLNNGEELNMTNSGAGGFNISGTVTNRSGDASISNTAGALYIDGQVTGEANSESLTITNKENGTGLTIDGRVDNINDLTISNESGTTGLNIAGTVTNTGDAEIKNSAAGGLNITGTVTNDGNADITNTGAGGLNVKGTGTVTNSTGYLRMTNNQDGMIVESGAEVTSSGSELNMTNTGTGGMHIQGLVENTNNSAKVEFNNSNSDMVIGHKNTDYNIQSNADIQIEIQNGNLRNYFADKDITPDDAGYNDAIKTLIQTTELADLTINADGQIGTDLGLCDGGVCTGIGPNERDLTKSINTSIEGVITADSTGEGALVNMASLDTDMRVDRIHAENGKVILLADSKDYAQKGTTPYDIINSAADNSTTPNLKGDAISAIASGKIGASKEDRITFIQTGVDIDIANENDEASQPHSDGFSKNPIKSSNGGVEFLAIEDVNIKGLDNSDASKNDTRVCTIVSREGSVNAEFSGETYINDITAQHEVNIDNRGPAIYIENLGGAPSIYAETGDYYGMYDGIVPEKADITALDLGTPDDPHTFETGHWPNSTIVIKNGTINGQGSTSHPGLDQDVTVTADNAYVGGYYFNMGKHREGGLSEVTKDPTTNTLVNAGDPDTPVSIRGKAVRPDDVTDIGQESNLRSYYYADLDGDGEPENPYPDGESGSGQKDDPTYDPDKEPADDLVVPEPDPEEPPPPGDDDDDEPDPPPPGDDDDDEPDPPPPGDDDDDEPDPPPPGDDDDDEPDPPPPGDDDDDEPDPPPPGDDDDDEPDPPPPGDDDDDEPEVTKDDAKQTWKKPIDDNISVIDKRQYIRFDIEGNPNPIVFESVPEVGGILNVSRGGVLLSHDKTLKVGDIVPVHLKYGDVEIEANVKIVSANDKTAGGEFVDLDLATANKLLYLSLLMDNKGNIQQDQMYANTQSGNISTTGEDE